MMTLWNYSSEEASEESPRDMGRSYVFPSPHRYTYSSDLDNSRGNIVLLYARLGLHRYNLLRGKDLQLSRITQFTKTFYSAASAYNVTLEAEDPKTTGSLLTFEAQVEEQDYGKFALELPSSGPLGETKKFLTVGRSCVFGYPVPELPPGKNPFEKDDTGRFYVLKISQVRKKKWIPLYLELAVATTNRRRRIENGVPKLKILRVAMEITRDLKPEEQLDAYDATFYIRYKDSSKSRDGDDDCVAIVRRILDVHSEIFKIVGCTQSSRTITPAPNEIAATEAGSSSAQD